MVLTLLPLGMRAAGWVVASGLDAADGADVKLAAPEIVVARTGWPQGSKVGLSTPAFVGGWVAWLSLVPDLLEGWRRSRHWANQWAWSRLS